MTLRVRLMAAAGAVLVLLAGVLAAIVVRQGAILTDQADEQLQIAAAAIGRGASGGSGPPLDLEVRRPDGGDLPFGDLYLGVLGPGGVLRSVVEPVSHPGFAPESDGLLARAVTIGPDDVDPVEPFTVDAVGGRGGARTVVVEVSGNVAVVVARSTDRIDEAQDQLAFTALLAVLAVAALLALALWWVDRLGLQPISRLTTAAEDVAAGRSDHRVEHPPTTTETGRLGAAFNTMLDARQEAEDRQRRFVADASHELRTPLTTLRGYAALHASGGLGTPEAVDDAMGRIRSEADRMAALVEDLLALASLDEGRPLDRAPVELSQLLIDIGSDAAAVQPDRPVDTSGVAPGLVVEADRGLLTQAITAVTSNVLRHTPPEAGLTLRAARRSVGGGRDVAVIRIEDRGPGIEAEHLPHLFDRFYRLDPSRGARPARAAAGTSGGRGLGLSIARTVVEAHDGTIGAESSTSTTGVGSEGTIITIQLPVGPSA